MIGREKNNPGTSIIVTEIHGTSIILIGRKNNHGTSMIVIEIHGISGKKKRETENLNRKNEKKTKFKRHASKTLLVGDARKLET